MQRNANPETRVVNLFLSFIVEQKLTSGLEESGFVPSWSLGQLLPAKNKGRINRRKNLL